MIDKKKLLEDLRKCYCGHLGMENSDSLIAFKSVCKIINEQPKIGEWIPCSERLPNVLRCRVTLEYDMEVGPTVYETKDAFFEKWQDGYRFTDDWMNDITCNVIAWQPLPEPYKP